MAESSNSSFFGPISSYFETVATNSQAMLHLNCLVWLKKMSSFFDLNEKIVDKHKFKTRLLLFLDQVIRCKLTPIDMNQVLPEIGLSSSATNDASVIVLQFKDNAILIISRVQMHFWTYNATYFKYYCIKTNCRFNFPRLIISDLYIDNTGFIYL